MAIVRLIMMLGAKLTTSMAMATGSMMRYSVTSVMAIVQMGTSMSGRQRRTQASTSSARGSEIVSMLRRSCFTPSSVAIAKASRPVVPT